MRTISIITSALMGVALTTPAHAQTGIQLACVSANGLARIVPTGTVCDAKEREVSWVLAGPSGPPGTAGARGIAGAAGASGPAGVPGARGATGAPGSAGPAGARGPAGPVGAPGPLGAAGPAGQAGSPGTPGSPGPAGSVGTAGPAGGAGPAGPAGPMGPPGVSEVGPWGIAGQLGPTGASGPPGPQGPAGSQNLFGTGTNYAAAGLSYCVIGSVWLSAGSVAGGLVANGQSLSIDEYWALFTLLGTTYGGDGQTTFNLPDLRSRAPNGLSYWICQDGIYPSHS